MVRRLTATQVARKRKGSYVRQTTRCAVGSAVVQHIDLTKDWCFDKEEVEILQSMQGGAAGRHKVEQKPSDDASAAPVSSPSTKARQGKTRSPTKQALEKSPSKVVSIIDGLRDEYDESVPVVHEEQDDDAQEDVRGSGEGTQEGEQGIPEDDTEEDEDVSEELGGHACMP